MVEINIGKFVEPASEMFEIVDNEHIHIDLHVYEKDINAIKIGQKVLFSLASNEGVDYEAVVFAIGKAFEKSAPMAPIIPASDLGHPVQGLIDLKVNGVLKQKGDLNQMIWKTAEMISYLSTYYELAAGDLIMSGTPAGVGPIVKGDIMTGSIAGMGELLVTVV